jgi:two-component system sensor histidine kinase KdpD
VLAEFDLDGALAFGREHPGALLLLDELAHSNAPGSRHPKRWQDVEELLEAGMDVWTTVNVQHLESLNDIVSGITGVRVWETVPDSLFDAADEVVVVDLPPDELLARLKAGKVYAAAGRAGRRPFLPQGQPAGPARTGPAPHRRPGGRADAGLAPAQRGAGGVAQPRGPAGLRGRQPRGREAAAPLRPPGHPAGPALARPACGDPASARRPEAQRRRLERSLKLAQDLGAEVATLPAAELAPALVRYAREHNLSRLVIGRRPRHGWRAWRPWAGPLAEQVAALAEDLDLLQVALPAPRDTGGPPPGAAGPPPPRPTGAAMAPRWRPAPSPPCCARRCGPGWS